MKINRLVFFIALILVSFSLSLFAGGDTAKEQMKKMEPFLGKWKTKSTYPGTKLTIPGKLEYRWVLGKSYMMIEFVGQHPEREYWEAYAMIKYDPVKKKYISWDFFNANNPETSYGYWLSTDTVRFEGKTKKGTWGIDYTLKKGKTGVTVYQENWAKPKNGKRKITLKTDYIRVK
jgi:hypothetical protein